MTNPAPVSQRTLVVSPLLPTDSNRPRDLDGALVITPNREAARSLEVPSRSLESVARRLLARQGTHVAPPWIARRALVQAVEERAGVRDVFGFAAQAESTVREVMRSGVDLASLQQDESLRIRRLAAVTDGYRRALERAAREEGHAAWIDQADVLGRAAGLCSETGSPTARIAVVGYPRLPEMERRFIDAYAAGGSVVHLPDAPVGLFRENRLAVEAFARWGWVVEQVEPILDRVGRKLALGWISGQAEGTASGHQLSADGATAEARAYPDLDSEIRGVLADVKRLLLDGTPADQIAVVARHEQAYGEPMRAVADEYGVPFRVLYRVPLQQTRFGAWLTSAFEVLAEGFPYEQTARWLAGPLMRVLDADSWPQARLQRPRGEAAWRELGVKLPGAAWPDSATRSRFTELLYDLEAAYGIAERCAHWPRESLAVQAFTEALRTLPQRDEPMTFEAFRADVLELLEILAVPATPGHGGVELHTPLSLFGAEVEHMFVVGVAEGSLPSPVRPDPLLDPFERARLHASHPSLEDVTAAARREEMSFWALLQSASARIVLTYPRLVGRNETIPSPYLERLGIEPAEARQTTIGSRRELRRISLPEGRESFGDPLIERARHARQVELDRESERPYDAYDGMTSIPYAEPSWGVGVSRLIDMASCPFKFWAGTVLRLEEPAEAPASFDYALRGTLYHAALHLAVERARDSDDLRAAALAHLEEAFAEAERVLEERHDVVLSAFPQWEHDREEHLRVLRSAIRGPDFVSDDAEVLALEQGFQGEWRGLRVRGRIDRIDAVHGGAVLVDYKSGATVSGMAKDAAGKATVDLQLPVYREGASGVLRELMSRRPRSASPGRPPASGDELADPPRGTQELVAETRYYSVTKAKDISVPDAPEEELARIAHEVASGWREGAFPVDPDVHMAACAYCAFDPVCRKGPRLERKRRRE